MAFTQGTVVVLCILGLSLQQTSVAEINDKEVQFFIKNSTKITLVCFYGNDTEGQYFDVYRNGRQCLTAAFGACAPVANRGCQCEEGMAVNEVRFTINSPQDYDTLRCKVLNGVSKEETIKITSDVKPLILKTSMSDPSGTSRMPSTTQNYCECDTADKGFTMREIILMTTLGLLLPVNALIVALFMCRLRKLRSPHKTSRQPADIQLNHIQEECLKDTLSNAVSALVDLAGAHLKWLEKTEQRLSCAEHASLAIRDTADC